MQTADNKLTLYFFVLGQDLTAKELTFKATDADDNKYTSAEFDRSEERRVGKEC